MRRPAMAAIAVTVVALATGGVLEGRLAPASAAARRTAGTSTGTSTGTALEPVARPEPTRQIEWQGCAASADDQVGTALDDAGAECATIDVPLDYRRPAGTKIPIAVSRLKAADGARRLGTLLLNPGGPGGSGLDMPLIVKLSTGVAARYDLIGFDPRFTGVSAGLNCKWPVSSTMRGAGPDKTTFAQSVTFAKRLATLCGSYKSVLPYASTRNTARDMDTIRGALGESQISFLGYSYGSYLGAVYLQMFPTRAQRFVLDSNVNPTVYGPALFSQNGPAINAAMKNWSSFAALHNDAYKLGTSSKQVLANVELVRKAVEKKPLKIGKYTVDTHLLPVLLWINDDSVQALDERSILIRGLLDAAKGARTAPPQVLVETLASLNDPSASPLLSAQSAVLCADRAANRSTAAYLKDIDRHRKAEPLFGPMTRNVVPCTFWPTKPVERITTIRNAHPVLMVNAAGDTQTPYAGAQVMHKALTGSRLVTLRGAYRHGVFLTGGSNCVDRTVETYLVNGTLPRADLTCSTDRTTALPNQTGVLSPTATTPRRAPATPKNHHPRWPWEPTVSL